MHEEKKVSPFKMLAAILEHWHQMDRESIAQASLDLWHWAADSMHTLTEAQIHRLDADANIIMSLSHCKRIVEVETTAQLATLWRAVMEGGEAYPIGGMIHGDESRQHGKAMRLVEAEFRPKFSDHLHLEFERLVQQASRRPTTNERIQAYHEAGNALSHTFMDFTEVKAFEQEIENKCDLFYQLEEAELGDGPGA